jgi:hypothetical protein
VGIGALVPSGYDPDEMSDLAALEDFVASVGLPAVTLDVPELASGGCLNPRRAGPSA